MTYDLRLVAALQLSQSKESKDTGGRSLELLIPEGVPVTLMSCSDVPVREAPTPPSTAMFLTNLRDRWRRHTSGLMICYSSHQIMNAQRTSLRTHLHVN